MPDTSTESPTPSNWRKLHAYGLPAGSVRAVMALMVIGTIWGLLAVYPGRPIPEPLRDLLFIVLGHYFAVRGRAAPTEEPGPPPLFLPRGSIRLVLIAGFVVVAVMLQRQGRLAVGGQTPAVVTLILVFGFLLGVVLHRVATWLRGEGRRLPRWLEDLRATLSLVAAALLVLLIWDRAYPFLNARPLDDLLDRALRLGQYGPEHILAAIVGFYFGSRS